MTSTSTARPVFLLVESQMLDFDHLRSLPILHQQFYNPLISDGIYLSCGPHLTIPSKSIEHNIMVWL